MRINGQAIKGPNKGLVVIPRDSGDIVFEIQAITDLDDFNSLCPEPQAPIVLRPGGIQQTNVEDPDYKTRVIDHNLKRFHWIVLKSLEATPNLEWETVKADDPDTWGNYEQELKDADFTQGERNAIIGEVLSVNSLDNTKLKEARDRFLAEHPRNGQKVSGFQISAPKNT